MTDSPKDEPSKPTQLAFDGFDALLSGRSEAGAQPIQRLRVAPFGVGLLIAKPPGSPRTDYSAVRRVVRIQRRLRGSIQHPEGLRRLASLLLEYPGHSNP